MAGVHLACSRRCADAGKSDDDNGSSFHCSGSLRLREKRKMTELVRAGQNNNLEARKYMQPHPRSQHISTRSSPRSNTACLSSRQKCFGTQTQQNRSGMQRPSNGRHSNVGISHPEQLVQEFATQNIFWLKYSLPIRSQNKNSLCATGQKADARLTGKMRRLHSCVKRCHIENAYIHHGVHCRARMYLILAET